MVQRSWMMAGVPLTAVALAVTACAPDARIDSGLRREMARRSADDRIPVAVWVRAAPAAESLQRAKERVRRRLVDEQHLPIQGEIEAEPILFVHATSKEIQAMLGVDGVAALYVYEVEGRER